MAKKNSTASAPAATDTKRGFSFTPDLVGDVVKTKEIELAPRTRNSRYAGIVDKLLSMKKGETLTIKLPGDTNMKRFKATMGTTLRNRASDALTEKGLRLSFGTTADNKLAVSIVEA